MEIIDNFAMVGFTWLFIIVFVIFLASVIEDDEVVRDKEDN
tara:strand:- start:119 stop:241 length:123 start_codon:yes stop_codon:yes gene_type:complete